MPPIPAPSPTHEPVTTPETLSPDETLQDISKPVAHIHPVPPDLPKSPAGGAEGPITKENRIPLAIRRLNFYNNPGRKETLEGTRIRSSRGPAQVTITPPPEEAT